MLIWILCTKQVIIRSKRFRLVKLLWLYHSLYSGLNVFQMDKGTKFIFPQCSFSANFCFLFWSRYLNFVLLMFFYSFPIMLENETIQKQCTNCRNFVCYFCTNVTKTKLHKKIQFTMDMEEKWLWCTTYRSTTYINEKKHKKLFFYFHFKLL